MGDKEAGNGGRWSLLDGRLPKDILATHSFMNNHVQYLDMDVSNRLDIKTAKGEAQCV